jgi:hypothetical protein
MAKPKKTNPDLWVNRPAASVTATDQFVSGPQSGRKPPHGFTRMNVNVPTALYARIKSDCALKGQTISEVILEFLESRFKR